MYRRPCLLLTAVLLLPNGSGAIELASRSVSLDIGPFSGLYPTAFLNLCISALAGPPDYDLCVDEPDADYLFSSLVVDSSDAGSTFVATADTDPGFVVFAGHLVNGVSEWFDVNWGPSGGSQLHTTGSTEGIFFFGNPPSQIDFAGNRIDAIELALSDDFSVTLFPSTNQTRVLGSATVRVLGEPLPEAGAVPLLALALGMGLALRRRPTRRSGACPPGVGTDTPH